MRTAYGVIETVGTTACIQAIDKMLKAGSVEIVSYENNGSGLVTIVVGGDVDSVKASVKAGLEGIESIGGEVVLKLVMPSPDRNVAKFIRPYAIS